MLHLSVTNTLRIVKVLLLIKVKWKLLILLELFVIKIILGELLLTNLMQWATVIAEVTVGLLICVQSHLKGDTNGCR